MHFFNCFTHIQALSYLCIISPRELPVESFLHDAWFLGLLLGLLLALHAFFPLPCSLFPQPITFSPFPTTPYIKTSERFCLKYLTACYVLFILVLKKERLVRYEELVVDRR